MKAKDIIANLRAEVETLSKITTVQGLALNAFLNKDVVWIRGSYGYSLGLANLLWGHGGLVFLRYAPKETKQRPTVNVHYLDDFVSMYRDNISGNEEVREIQRLSQLALELRRKHYARVEAAKTKSHLLSKDGKTLYEVKL